MTTLYEWQQPFDGSQPPVSQAEQRVVAGMFIEHIGSTLLTHLGKEYYDSGGPWGDCLAISLGSVADDIQPEPRITQIRVEDRIGRSLGITVCRVIEDSPIPIERTTIGSSYRMSRYEGIVRRKDWRIGPQQIALQREVAQLDITRLLNTVSHDHFLEKLQEVAQQADDEAARNKQLARELGLNDLPIGLAEIRGLMSVINSAQPLLPQ
jgi:hypothetical protein